MDRKSFKDALNKRFLDVKKQLDESKSYLIFENDVTRSGDSVFAEDLPVYRYLEQQKLEWQQIRDRQLEREYLIVQIEPGTEDQTLGRLMANRLPKDMVYYVYKANS